MNRLILTLVLTLAALAAAGTASATEFQNVIFAGGCTEWNAQLDVHFRIGMTEADIDYIVELVDSEDNVLLTSSGSAVVTDDDSDRLGTLMLSATWDETTDDIIELFGMYTVRASFTLYVPWQEYVFTYVEERAMMAECAVVDAEDISWGQLKGAYR
jgi:hypothetical protein